MKLIIAGGGTGGHLFPGIAVAEEFLGRDPENSVLFVGTERGIEARAVPAAGYQLEIINAAGIRGKGSLSQIKGALLMLHGYAQSRKILKKFRPDMVLGVGGYASLPMVLAAKGMQIPRYIHEQNAIPGMSNKILAKFVDQVFITLEESAKFFPPDRTLLTGNPLRQQILHQAAKTAEEGLRTGGQGRFRILIFGGSQGAHAINMAMISSLPFLERSKDQLEIIHQTGEKDCEQVAEAYRRQGFNATARAFIDNMADAYQWADFVICRAGATTIAEITATGKPCLFIPFPHAVDDHQRRNAEALLKKQAGFLLVEQELNGDSLASLIRKLIDDPALVKTTGQLAFGLARLDAARIIVDQMTMKTS